MVCWLLLSAILGICMTAERNLIVSIISIIVRLIRHPTHVHVHVSIESSVAIPIHPPRLPVAHVTATPGPIAFVLGHCKGGKRWNRSNLCLWTGVPHYFSL